MAEQERNESGWRSGEIPEDARHDAGASGSPSADLPAEPELYPAFLKLEGRRCLVVGGGIVGLQKAGDILRAGAIVRAVASRWPVDFTPLEQSGRLTRETRAFLPSDLAGVFLVVAATDDPAVQRTIWECAEALGILCNVVDVPEHCNFYVPASLRRGSLTVSVSTAGKSPLFAVGLRDRLARTLPPELGPALELMSEARRLVRSRYPRHQDARRAALQALLTSEAIDQLLEGDAGAFATRWESWRSSLSAELRAHVFPARNPEHRENFACSVPDAGTGEPLLAGREPQEASADEMSRPCAATEVPRGSLARTGHAFNVDLDPSSPDAPPRVGPPPPPRTGRVSLVGAGPGDSELLTLKAAQHLREADVVYYDALVTPEVLSHCRGGARLVPVGKRRGFVTLAQDEIQAAMVRDARGGLAVVRLKGGDPFVFGRGGEEALAMIEAGVSFETVPGISAGVAVPASAGIPLTHRGIASSVAFATAHDLGPGRAGAGVGERLNHLARGADTLVLFMAGAELDRVKETLRDAGLPAETPVALIESGTTEDQRVITGSLANLDLLGEGLGGGPVLLVIGQTVALAAQIGVHRTAGAEGARGAQLSEAIETTHELLVAPAERVGGTTKSPLLRRTSEDRLTGVDIALPPRGVSTNRVAKHAAAPSTRAAASNRVASTTTVRADRRVG